MLTRVRTSRGVLRRNPLPRTLISVLNDPQHIPHEAHPKAHTRDQRGISPIAQRALDEEAYRLHVEDMLTTHEIARRQGVSQGTAVRRCQRAERRLAALFAEDVRTLRFRQ